MSHALQLRAANFFPQISGNFTNLPIPSNVKPYAFTVTPNSCENIFYILRQKLHYVFVPPISKLYFSKYKNKIFSFRMLPYPLIRLMMDWNCPCRFYCFCFFINKILLAKPLKTNGILYHINICSVRGLPCAKTIISTVSFN